MHDRMMGKDPEVVLQICMKKIEKERFPGRIPLYHMVEFEWLRRSDVV